MSGYGIAMPTHTVTLNRDYGSLKPPQENNHQNREKTYVNQNKYKSKQSHSQYTPVIHMWLLHITGKQLHLKDTPVI